VENTCKFFAGIRSNGRERKADERLPLSNSGGYWFTGGIVYLLGPTADTISAYAAVASAAASDQHGGTCAC